MKTWFSFCERLVALIGRLAEAKTLFYAWMSIKIFWRAAAIWSSLVATL